MIKSLNPFVNKKSWSESSRLKEQNWCGLGFSLVWSPISSEEVIGRAS